MLLIVTTCGFDVALSTDNYSANRKFYTNELCQGKMQPSVVNPYKKESRIYLLIENAHNVKNCYNFWNKKEFICPSFRGEEKGQPNFNHIKHLFDKECGGSLKFARRLHENA